MSKRQKIIKHSLVLFQSNKCRETSKCIFFCRIYIKNVFYLRKNNYISCKIKSKVESFTTVVDIYENWGGREGNGMGVQSEGIVWRATTISAQCIQVPCYFTDAKMRLDMTAPTKLAQRCHHHYLHPLPIILCNLTQKHSTTSWINHDLRNKEFINNKSASWHYN